MHGMMKCLFIFLCIALTLAYPARFSRGSGRRTVPTRFAQYPSNSYGRRGGRVGYGNSGWSSSGASTRVQGGRQQQWMMQRGGRRVVQRGKQMVGRGTQMSRGRQVGMGQRRVGTQQQQQLVQRRGGTMGQRGVIRRGNSNGMSQRGVGQRSQMSRGRQLGQRNSQNVMDRQQRGRSGLQRVGQRSGNGNTFGDAMRSRESSRNGNGNTSSDAMRRRDSNRVGQRSGNGNTFGDAMRRRRESQSQSRGESQSQSSRDDNSGAKLSGNGCGTGRGLKDDGDGAACAISFGPPRTDAPKGAAFSESARFGSTPVNGQGFYNKVNQVAAIAIKTKASVEERAAAAREALAKVKNEASGVRRVLDRVGSGLQSGSSMLGGVGDNLKELGLERVGDAFKGASSAISSVADKVGSGRSQLESFTGSINGVDEGDGSNSMVDKAGQAFKDRLGRLASNEKLQVHSEKVGRIAGLAGRALERVKSVSGLAQRSSEMTGRLGRFVSDIGSRASSLASAAQGVGEVSDTAGASGVGQAVKTGSEMLGSVGSKLQEWGSKLQTKAGAAESLAERVSGVSANTGSTLQRFSADGSAAASATSEASPLTGAGTNSEGRFRGLINRASSMLSSRVNPERLGKIGGLANRVERFGTHVNSLTQGVAGIAGTATSYASELGSRFAAVGDTVSSAADAVKGFGIGGAMAERVSDIGKRMKSWGESVSEKSSKVSDSASKLVSASSEVARNVQDAGAGVRGLMSSGSSSDDSSSSSDSSSSDRNPIISKVGGYITNKMKFSPTVYRSLNKAANVIRDSQSVLSAVSDGVSGVSSRVSAVSSRVGGMISGVGSVLDNTASFARGMGQGAANVGRALGMTSIPDVIEQRVVASADRVKAAADAVNGFGEKLQGIASKATSVTDSVAGGVRNFANLAETAHTGVNAFAGAAAMAASMDVSQETPPPNFVERTKARMAPLIERAEKYRQNIGEKIDNSLDRMAANPLAQKVGHNVLRGMNKGFKVSASVFRKLDSTVDKAVDYAAKGTFKAINAMTSTVAGRKVADLTNKVLDSRVGQFVRSKAEDVVVGSRHLAQDAAAPVRMLQEKAEEHYANLGERFGIDREESKQAVKDMVTTAVGVAQWAPVAVGIGQGINAAANLGIMARQHGWKAATQSVVSNLHATASQVFNPGSGYAENMVNGVLQKVGSDSRVGHAISSAMSSNLGRTAAKVTDIAMSAKDVFDTGVNMAGNARQKIMDLYERGQEIHDALTPG